MEVRVFELAAVHFSVDSNRTIPMFKKYVYRKVCSRTCFDPQIALPRPDYAAVRRGLIEAGKFPTSPFRRNQQLKELVAKIVCLSFTTMP